MVDTARRIFLGWDRAPLEAVAEWLAREHGKDMSRLCVALPGARAGRRLQERLARMLGPTWQPPRIVTAGKLTDEMLVLGGRTAGRIVRTLAWERSLRGLPEASASALVARLPPQTDESAWARLAEQVRELFGALAGDALDFAALARATDLPPGESARWRALAGAEEAMLAALREVDLLDPHLARLDALEKGAVRADLDVVLAGVVEMNELLRRTCEGLGKRMTALVLAPEAEADSFDALGRLAVAHWKDRDVPLPLDRWWIVGGPEEQARQALSILAGWNGRFSAEEITVGVADAEVTPHLMRRLRKQGVASRDAAGTPIECTPPLLLIEAAADHLAGRSFESYAALVRHPDFEAALRTMPELSDAEPAAWLDAYLAEHLPARAAGPWLGPPGAATARLELLHRSALTLLGDLASADSQPLHAWVQPIRRLLTAVWSERPLVEESEPDRVLAETMQKIAEVLVEMESLPVVLAPETTSAGALRWLLRTLRHERIAPAAPRPGEPTIELLGWLELALDDAPALVVTGFVEGFVPASVRADAWLPDSLRRSLGLEDDERRVARDAYATTLCCATRAEFAFVSGRRTAEGDPLVPSRLAFHVPADEIPARVEHAFAARATPPIGLAAPLRARELPRGPAVPPPRVLRVTSFRTFLDSPYLFYLRCVLGLETFEHDGRELDPLGFGVLAHEVLQALGRDELREERDERRVDAALQDELSALARDRFGARPLPAVELQIAQLSWRLRHFAARQAERAAQGWRVEHVEWAPSRPATLDVDGESVELSGRIDRIDRHPASGRWAILDYKAGDKVEPPEKTHRKRDGTWRDLQLPLYVHLAAELGLPGVPELGYACIGREPAWIGFESVDWDRGVIDQAIEAARVVVRAVLDGDYFELGHGKPREAVFAALCGQGLLAQTVPGDSGDREEEENGA